MKKKHLTGTTAFHPGVPLKPLVIAVSTALGMAGLLAGCNDNDANLILGAFGVSASGGKGGTATGNGGAGGTVMLYAYYDNTTILVTTGGSDLVPDVTDWPSAPSLGSNSHTFSSDATLDVCTVDLAGMFTGACATTPPATGVPYQVENDCNVYVSDGDAYGGNEPAVTGIEVGSGATLTLSEYNGAGTGACVDLYNDLANRGHLTAGAGVMMNLTVEDYFGFADSTVDSAGDATNIDGGDIFITARTSNYNAGDMTSKGFTSSTDDGGLGGEIRLEGDGADMWNSGKLDSSGGDTTLASTGGGGDGGNVTLYGYNSASGGGTVISAGEIDSSGGDGPASGGSGGDVFLYNWAPGDLFVTAGINLAGGDTTGADGDGGSAGDFYAKSEGPNSKMVLVGFREITTAGGDGAQAGGDGGDVSFSNDAGDSSKYINEAAINTQGGDATLSTGSWYAGGGGTVDFYNDGGDGYMHNSGPIDTSGGNAASGYGGSGGTIDFYFYDGHGVIENTAALTANGGKGTDGGGDGGFVGMYVSGGGSTGSGSIDNSGNITNRGGNATTGYAGGGGGVEIELGDDGSIDGDVSNSGIIDSSGGSSTSGQGGSGGGIEIENEASNGGPGQVTNSASLTTNGGSGAYGGLGGSIWLYNIPVAVGNDLSNSAPLSTRGGNGTVDGGHGGSVYFYADHVANNSSITTSGGNGGSGTGGDGGDVDMLSDSVATDNTGPVTTTGGIGGTSNGSDGTFTKDGVVQ